MLGVINLTIFSSEYFLLHANKMEPLEIWEMSFTIGEILLEPSESQASIFEGSTTSVEVYFPS